MPVRNGLPWLREALDSLYAQTLGDLEIIAIDDGSTDGTTDVLAAEQDARLRVVTTIDRGMAAALNHGLELARGRYIARQDADDVSAPGRLARQLACLDAHPGIDVLATCADYIAPDGSVLDNEWTRTIRAQQDVATAPEAIRAMLPLTCCLTHGSVMLRTQVLRRAGGYRGEYAPAEDYELWLRLLLDHRFAKLADRLYRYRVHELQWSATTRPAQLEHTIQAKLEFLRCACPWLPEAPRMAIHGQTRGDAAYRAVAPKLGFVVLATDRPGRDGWDVLGITDFARLQEHTDAWQHDISTGRMIREGNFFVRCKG
jgi:hypothetical protein